MFSVRQRRRGLVLWGNAPVLPDPYGKPIADLHAIDLSIEQSDPLPKAIEHHSPNPDQ
jgi:hypothetical protein